MTRINMGKAPEAIGSSVHEDIAIARYYAIGVARVLLRTMIATGNVPV